MLRQLGPVFATTAEKLVQGIEGRGSPLRTSEDLDPLVDLIGDARLVLLGEASHGTSEYYTWRAQLSRRLIEEKGFSFIAVEGDWPSCYGLNRYVQGYPDAGENALQVLRRFERWPTWMWANWEVAALSEWLRGYNERQPQERKAGFYGLDVYSLWESLAEVMDYLESYDTSTLDVARRAFLCFEPYGQDVQAYARATTLVPQDCEDEVVDLLRDVRRRVQDFPGDPHADFNAQQNAYVLAEAEHYYRTMVAGGSASWNVRDYHMADTLDRLLNYYGESWDGLPRAIVWQHNTHIGDARYTDMAEAGMVNVGQLARERHEDEGVVLVGFASYQGQVIASSQWGAPMQRMRVPPAQPGSWESVLHKANDGDRLYIMDQLRDLPAVGEWRGHRAIGVVYHPDYEYGNYVPTVLPRRYDALLFVDNSRALHPLPVQPKDDQPPELYPWGL